jgi:DNA-binding transcriptional LysR family regulator
LTLGSTQAVLSAIREGVGLGFVSLSAAQPQIDCGGLQLVGIPGFRLTRTLWLVYERGRATGALRGAFLEAVRGYAGRGGPPLV